MRNWLIFLDSSPSLVELKGGSLSDNNSSVGANMEDMVVATSCSIMQEDTIKTRFNTILPGEGIRGTVTVNCSVGQHLVEDQLNWEVDNTAVPEQHKSLSLDSVGQDSSMQEERSFRMAISMVTEGRESSHGGQDFFQKRVESSALASLAIGVVNQNVEREGVYKYRPDMDIELGQGTVDDTVCSSPAVPVLYYVEEERDIKRMSTVRKRCCYGDMGKYSYLRSDKFGHLSIVGVGSRGKQSDLLEDSSLQAINMVRLATSVVDQFLAREQDKPVPVGEVGVQNSDWIFHMGGGVNETDVIWKKGEMVRVVENEPNHAWTKTDGLSVRGNDTCNILGKQLEELWNSTRVVEKLCSEEVRQGVVEDKLYYYISPKSYMDGVEGDITLNSLVDNWKGLDTRTVSDMRVVDMGEPSGTLADTADTEAYGWVVDSPDYQTHLAYNYMGTLPGFGEMYKQPEVGWSSNTNYCGDVAKRENVILLTFIAALGCFWNQLWYQEDDLDGEQGEYTIDTAEKKVKQIDDIPGFMAGDNVPGLAISLGEEQQQITVLVTDSCTELPDVEDQQKSDFCSLLPYSKLVWEEVVYDEARAEHRAARVMVKGARIEGRGGAAQIS